MVWYPPIGFTLSPWVFFHSPWRGGLARISHAFFLEGEILTQDGILPRLASETWRGVENWCRSG